jgi:hypothetical protein
MELNEPGFLISPKMKKIRMEVDMFLGCTSKTICGYTLIRIFFLSFFVCGIQSWNLSKYFRYTLYIGDWIFTFRRSNQYLLLSFKQNILYWKTWLAHLVSFMLIHICLMILIYFNLIDSQILSEQQNVTVKLS